MLLIARKDRKVADSEIRLVKHVGEALGFDSRFCADAIGEVLENNYLRAMAQVRSGEEWPVPGLVSAGMRDGELLFVVGHEVGHVVKKYVREKLQSFLGGGFAALLGLIGRLLTWP